MCICFFTWASYSAVWTCHWHPLLLESNVIELHYIFIRAAVWNYTLSMLVLWEKRMVLGRNATQLLAVRDTNVNLGTQNSKHNLKYFRYWGQFSGCALFFTSQVTLGAGAKDELHVVEAEALDYEGNPTKVVLASLKMSVQPTVSKWTWNNLLQIGSQMRRVY